MTTATPSHDPPIDSLRHIRSKADLKRFACGVREIDRWASEKAFKFHEKGRARVKVAMPPGAQSVCAFYSVSATMAAGQKLLRSEDRDAWQDKAPLVYIDYIAVSTPRQGAGIGSILLVDALRTAVRAHNYVPFYGIGLRSLNDRTTALYERYGFRRAPKEDDRNPLMILPIWTAVDLLEP